MRFWLALFIVLGGSGLSAVHAQEKPPTRVIRPTGAVEPGSPDSLLSSSAVAAAASTTGCKLFGTNGIPQFPFANIFRGNVFRIENNATLNEFKMELSFTGTADLFFSVHRRLSAATTANYDRVGSDTIVRATGDGTQTFYSTGRLASPVMLEAGYDYVIGVAWKNIAVTYFRALQAPPVRFVNGEILGTAGINSPAPVADSTSIFLFTGGAHSMALCLEPQPGACCRSTTTMCEASVLESNCNGLGDFFAGELTGCTTGLCTFGACCLPCGASGTGCQSNPNQCDPTCEDDFTPEACTAVGGTFAGTGVMCPGTLTDLCPVVTGACCHPSEVGSAFNSLCDVTCVDDCVNNLNGVFLGNGTDCEPNMCVGACCIADLGCSEFTRDFCTIVAPGGVFKGEGTTCDSLSPGQECGGACCLDLLGSSICSSVPDRALCSAKPNVTNTVFMGDTTRCFQVDCMDPGLVSGACCLPNGTCLVTEQSYCLLVAGADSFSAGVRCPAVSCTTCCTGGNCQRTIDATACTGSLGGTVDAAATSCTPNSCGLAMGACCFGDGTTACIDNTTLAACDGAGGLFQGDGTTCGVMDANCPALGSCCRPNGVCDDNVTAAQCTVFGGSFSLDTPCFLAMCTAACCASDGTCTTDTEANCVAGGGVFVGAGSFCSGSTCPTGACCTPSGCQELTQDGCSDVTGATFLGTGTDCTPNLCDQPCCAADGTCTLTDEAACTANGGTFVTTTNACSTGTCPTEACCTNTGCAELTSAGCAAAGGVLQGMGTLCTPNPCSQACCAPDGTCDDTGDENACLASGGTFRQNDVTCGAGTCPTGACCTATGCQLLTMEGCAATGGNYQGDGTSCIPNPCMQACCDASATCSVADETTCTGGGGTFLDSTIDCSTSPCLTGACCAADGTCTTEFTALCAGGGMRFDGPGSSCGTIPCVTGACCTNTGCQDLTSGGCADVGGVFEGDGTACATSTCGACCAADGTCTIELDASCSTAGGVPQGGGTSCAVGTCPTEACCTSTGCQELTSAGCAAAAGTLQGVGTVCTPNPCSQACCAADGTCTLTDETACTGGGGTFKASTVVCDASSCPTGACCDSGTCTVLTMEGCAATPGSYLGDGTICAPSPCTIITASMPPNCVIDAREPTDPDGANPNDSFTLTFDADPTAIVAGDLTLGFTGAALPMPLPTIANVQIAAAPPNPPNTLTITLDQPIPTRAWTCITYDPSNSKVCFGSLPGDVDNNGMSELADLNSELNCLSGLQPCQLWQCDADRSGVFGPPDVLRTIDLINGADQFEVWLGATLSGACPNP